MYHWTLAREKAAKAVRHSWLVPKRDPSGHPAGRAVVSGALPRMSQEIRDFVKGDDGSFLLGQTRRHGQVNRVLNQVVFAAALMGSARSETPLPTTNKSACG